MDFVLSEYLNKSHNFTNLIFMTSSLRYSIKFGKQLSSTSAVVLHGSGTAAIQTSYFCRAKPKFINYINVFWRDCVPTGSWEKNCYEASVNEGLNGVNRLATNGKKYYRLPTKREKNYRLPTWTDIIYIFFRKKSILYFFYLSRK